MEQRLSTHREICGRLLHGASRVASWLLLAILCACALSGCPNAEQEWSGTYIEASPAQLDEVRVLDVFRFGEHLMMVRRRFRRDLTSEQLGDQIDCEWSELAETFDEDSGAFKLSFKTAQETVQGSINGDAATMRVTITAKDGTAGGAQTFQRLDDAPDNSCDRIDPYFLKPDFRLGTEPNVLDGYTARTPAFALLWVAVEAQQQDGFVQWIALNQRTPVVPLSSDHFSTTTTTTSLHSGLALSVSPPPERVLVQSGTTRYALAHLVVIDHGEGFQQGDSWDVATEPIIASALEPGQRANSPANATGAGKALLFVEGDLGQLDAAVQLRIRNRADYLGVQEGQHFYIVDVFYNDDSIVAIDLPEDPLRDLILREVRLRASDQYLTTTTIALPRLFPL